MKKNIHNKTAPTIKILSRRIDQRCGTSFDETWLRTTMNIKKGKELYPISYINRWLMQLLLSRYRRTHGVDERAGAVAVITDADAIAMTSNHPMLERLLTVLCCVHFVFFVG